MPQPAPYQSIYADSRVFVRSYLDLESEPNEISDEVDEMSDTAEPCEARRFEVPSPLRTSADFKSPPLSPGCFDCSSKTEGQD